jgi:hypothetical protein
MLIDKGVSPNEIITLKLITGEEVIAKLIEEKADLYVLSKPSILSLSQQGVGMAPFFFTVNPDKNIKINKSATISVEPTDKDFADKYIQATTGIQL